MNAQGKTRIYSCLICEEKLIEEKEIEIPRFVGPEATHQDGYVNTENYIVGGKLFKNRLYVPYQIVPGGICDMCLRIEAIKRMDEGGHILFE